MSTRDILRKLKEKKLLIYGMGDIARSVLQEAERSSVVGILDRFHLEGEFEGYPIVMIEDIGNNDADAIIIASSSCHYKEIYERIEFDIYRLNIDVYGADGVDLRKQYFGFIGDRANAQYFLQGIEDLKSEIEKHEAISFDLFDTLLMRRTLEPVDVFDIVEKRIEKKGIKISNFKAKRRTAELKSNGKDIDCIYEILKETLYISDNEICIIKEEEIQCEKEVLIPRKYMVEMMNYAISLGKCVNIISDMYLPANILADILEQNGVRGYSKLYVSCDYGKSKGSGLYEEYKKDFPQMTYLHIGDNVNADIIAAQRSGIDAYYVKSGLELLKCSNLRKCLMVACSKNERRYIGEVTASIFNNPFCLNKRYGVVSIDNVKDFSNIYILPTVIVYMQHLKKVVESEGYKGILFGARDGSLFHRIYQAFDELRVEGVPCYYIPASRKLGISLASDADMGIRENYRKNLNQMGIDLDGKYLFCDLVSSGTMHNGINRIFKNGIDGFYLYKYEKQNGHTLRVHVALDCEEGVIVSCFWFLEKIITASHASINSIDEDGIPVYNVDNRSQEEISILQEVWDEVIDGLKRYLEIALWEDGYLDTRLMREFFASIDYSEFSGKIEIIENMTLQDDVTGLEVCTR